VGLDNIDVPACEARGMQVIPATGANALSVAEYVVATRDAAAARRLPVHRRGGGRPVAAQRAVQRPRAPARRWAWSASARSASTTARLARGLGMEVIAFDAMMDADHPAFADGGVRCAGLDEVIMR
jgi:(S)-sulfolactate dehydrogenase